MLEFKRNLTRMLSVKSPQSVRAIEEDDEISFTDTDQPVFSVHVPSKRPTKQRISYLWKRARKMIRPISRLIKIWKDNQRFGSSRNHLAQTFATNDFDSDAGCDDMDKYLFLPENRVLKFWAAVILILLIYTASIVPYRLCFMDDSSAEWFIVDNLVDLLFFLDILVTFNSCYYDEEMNIIGKRRLIAFNYLKGWFFIDFTACIPIQILISSNDSYNKLVRIAKIPRIYRILRFIKLFKFVRVFKTIDFINRLAEYLKMTEGIVRLLKVAITVLLIIHINGCIWYLLAKFDDMEIENWLFRYSMEELSNGETYLISIYFVMQTIATIGFGDIVPLTWTEKFYTSLLIIVGVGFYSSIVSNLSSIVKTIDNDQARIAGMLSALKEFAKATKLPENLKENIKRHIETSTEPVLQNFDKIALVKELPASLKKEVQIHMHKKIVGKIYFFQDKDAEFIARFVAKLKTMELQRDEIIYRKGDYSEEIYFITKGRVAMKAENGIVFKNYMQGSYFGELEVLNNVNRKCSVQVASSKSSILIISKREFLMIMKDYPEIFKEVKDTASLREQKIAEANVAMLQTILSSRMDFNKAKTSNEQAKNLKVNSKPLISRQSWKHFLKNSLGIQQTQEPPCEIQESIWNRYNNYREKNEKTANFISKHSLSELFIRVNHKEIFPGTGQLCSLPKGTFARPFLNPRTEKIKFPTNNFEVDEESPTISSCESIISDEFSIGSLLFELEKCERNGQHKLRELTNLLDEMYTQQLEIKTKLAKYYVKNSFCNYSGTN